MGKKNERKKVGNGKKSTQKLGWVFMEKDKWKKVWKSGKKLNK